MSRFGIFFPEWLFLYRNIDKALHERPKSIPKVSLLSLR